MRYNIGDLISFSYPPPPSTQAHDRYPRILVLHPNSPTRRKTIAGYKTTESSYTHGLNFNYLTDDEINLIRMMIDPGFQLKYFYNLRKKNPNLANEFERIINRAGNAVMTSPEDFYRKAIRPFIMTRGWDPYRLYVPDKMSSVRMVQSHRIMTGDEKAGLFGITKTRDKGVNEKEILKDLAQKDAEGRLGVENPQEKRFVSRLQGKARQLFDNYKKKFQYAKGSRLPTFRR